MGPAAIRGLRENPPPQQSIRRGEEEGAEILARSPAERERALGDALEVRDVLRSEGFPGRLVRHGEDGMVHLPEHARHEHPRDTHSGE